VRSLFLASTVCESDSVLREFIGLWSEAARLRDPQRLFDASHRMNFSDAYIVANRSAIEAAAARYTELDMDAVLELLDCFNRLDLTKDLHRINAPTLVLVGEKDVLKPRKYSERIAREIPGADLVVVPSAGHAICLEKPNLFNAILLGFLTVNQG